MLRSFFKAKPLSFPALIVLGVVPLVSGCGAGQADDDAPVVVEGASEDALTGSERKAQLDGLRVRVEKDFANVASLRSKKLVFVVKKLTSDKSRAVIFAHILKRDARGDAELVDADYKGSAYEKARSEGYFDGPDAVAALAKQANGSWTIMKKGDLEAYAVGPSDVPFVTWDEDFGVPRSWLGLL